MIFAIYLELITSKAEKVLMEKVYTRCLNMVLALEWTTNSSINEKSRVLPTNVFREIVKRLHSFGLVSLTVETNKITDNV